MSKMKDSGIEWIGQIPEEWTLSKIGAVYEERNTKVSDKDYAPLSVTKQGIVPQLETAAKTDNGDNRKLIKKNDFAINSRSDRRGSCGISEFEGSCSLINTVLKPRQNMCNRYYNYVFHSDVFSDEFYRWGNGIVDDLWSTKWGEMKRIYIPYPLLAVQSRIADYLDEKCGEIDRYIEKQQQIIEKLKAYKQAVITEAVTKGLDPTVPMKDSGIEWIGEIPKDWDVIISRFVIDNIVDVDHYMPESVEIGYPYVMTGDLKESLSEVDFDKCKKISSGDYVALSQKIYPMKGNVIFARYATIGTVCYVDYETECVVSYSCVTVQPSKDKLNGKFLFYYFKSQTFKEEVQQYITSNTQANIGIEAMYRSKIVVPPTDEQKRIALYLDNKCEKIDETISKTQMSIDKLSEYKKSLIYESVTGKLEI